MAWRKEINHQSKLQFGDRKVRIATGQTKLNLAAENQQNQRRLRGQTKMFQPQK